MTGAELLPLLREIQKRGGPIQVHEAYTADADTAVRVTSAGRFFAMWLGLHRSPSFELSWAIVGALMEDMAAKRQRPILDMGRTGRTVAMQYEVGIKSVLGQWYPTTLEAACRAWLAAHPDEVVS